MIASQRFLLLSALALILPEWARAQNVAAIRLDNDPNAPLCAIRADTRGRVFVGGGNALFEYAPDTQGGYFPRRLVYRFSSGTDIRDIEIRGDDVYVLTHDTLCVIADGAVKRQDLVCRKLVCGVPRGDERHGFHALTWGPTGDLYLSMGEPTGQRAGNWTLTSQPEGTRTVYRGVGAILRCRPDGSGLAVIATGLRHPTGLCFDRRWNLFTVDGDAGVQGRVLYVTGHADFGWPHDWTLDQAPPRADLLPPASSSEVGRSFPVRMTYYDEDLLPERFRDHLIMTRPDRRALMHGTLKPRRARFTLAGLQLLWRGKDSDSPTSIAVGRGGRIFITQMHGAKGALTMLTPAMDATDHPFAPYDAPRADGATLWAELGDASWQRRYRAHIEILRRGGDLLKDAERRLLATRPEAPAFVHLIWLTAAGPRKSLHLVTLAGHPDAAVRLQAVRALAEFPEHLRDDPVFVKRLIDPDPRVRLAAVLAFFGPKVRWLDAARRQVEAGPARSDDPYLRQAATRLLAAKATLRQIADLCAENDAPGRLAGALAVGFRLAQPRRGTDNGDERQRLLGLLRILRDDADERVRRQAEHFLRALDERR